MRIIKCSLHLNIHLAFQFHIVVSQFPFVNLFWISNLELKTWKIFSICFDKYFGIWLLNIKHLLKYIGSKLKYICFVSIDLAIYETQITSYDANLSFFMDEFIIYVIIQHTKPLSTCFFALNLKTCRILRFMIPPTFNDLTQDSNFDNLGSMRSWVVISKKIQAVILSG